MYKRFYIALLLLLAVEITGQAKVVETKDNQVFTFSTGSEKVKLEFCSDVMFRVRVSRNGNFELDEHLMQEQYNWPIVAVKANNQKGTTTLTTAKLQVKVTQAPFKINVFTLTGQLISADKAGYLRKGDTVGCSKQLLADEHFFGFGERMDFIDQRNKLLKLNVGRGKSKNNQLGAYDINQANYCPVPFFMSTKGYGIFLHNSFATEWDMGNSSDNTYSFKAVDGELDYYFIYGPDFPAVLKSYLSVTGKSPLIPRFAFGLHMGTYSGGTWGHEEQTSDRYVIALARRMREMGIPVDLLFLDSTWRLFGKTGGKGATSFEWRETFKNPKGMFDSLYAMHYKMVGLHIRGRFDNARNLNLLEQAQAKGFTYPEGNHPGEFVNFFDQKAVDWWWSNGVMRVGEVGAKFLKTDEGSAFGALANESEKVGPTGKTVEKLHNVFPIAYAKAPFLKFQQFNGFRGLNQTREGYAGIQRYPYIFAGDWPSEWQYFAPVIKAGINIGLSGVGYWGHCMGGFEHQADPELYIRWVQFGMFSPIAMVFGMDHPGYKEPWNYGDSALVNFKMYDRLRYQLVPYIYSAAFKQYQTGVPLMRALVMDYQHNPNVYDIGDQYLFGDNLMICPVTVKGAQTRIIYLPEGNWYNYWTGEQYTGKQYIHILTPLLQLPVFVKAGSIIPMQPEMNYMNEKPVDVITLDIFPGPSGNFKLYEDDGLSLNYQQGNYAITNITQLSNSKQVFTLRVSKPVGAFVPEKHQYIAKIHWTGKLPTIIAENGESLNKLSSQNLAGSAGWYYDEDMHVLYVRTKYTNQQDIVIQCTM
ncbi:DUF4968 domain-containing protein [Mucilaginibacter robiniae]|uniref:DUF4968 domain-containing protein n=1 Tax=Mucilaginibacter robiniae TaxID=2728022 RepID=A0A7L5E113_9SPHI|nr:TIM-barrel domain-containing protein [Mucilaginibacter robiniae]QJD95234.1 DUF4968 domain-containing protein [Mucilaginibacter robiniae]